MFISHILTQDTVVYITASVSHFSNFCIYFIYTTSSSENCCFKPQDKTRNHSHTIFTTV